MGFAEDVYRLAAQVATRKDRCKGNEEATKTSLILPFFQMLGYDVHDPDVVQPEYKAGFASNKEKIDYALCLGGAPILFVEAKAVSEKLDNHDAQLAKYFNSTPGVKWAIITNGVRYKFFTDTKETNLMDPDPLFEFELESIHSEEVALLERFCATGFDPSGLVQQAEDLSYLRALKRDFRTLLRDPSDEFVRFMCSGIFPRKITEKALERLTPLVRQAMSSVLLEMVSQGLSQEISKQEEETVALDEVPAGGDVQKSGVVTTEEELIAFNVIYQTIAEACGEDQKVMYKDSASYCSILLEKPSRWFARLYFGTGKKTIALRVPQAEANLLPGMEGRAEAYSQALDACRVTLASLDELNGLKPLLVAAYRSVQQTVAL